MVLPQGDEAKFVFGLQRDENAQIDEYIEGAIRFSTTQYDPSYVKSAKKDIFQSRAFVILSESPLRVEYAD